MTQEAIQSNEHNSHTHHAHEHTHEEHHSAPKNPIDALGQKIWDNRKTIFLLLVIFIFAMSVRSNLIRYDGNYLFEPDAFYHARMIMDFVRDGVIPQPDNLVYYELVGGVSNQTMSIYWLISAILYWIVSLGAPFNKELFSFVIQASPALFGALISVSMYFLAKEIFNNKTIGLITAFAAAITPAFVYRTMAGAQGDNSLGFLWMAIGFVFFVRAVKTKTLNKNDIINAILAGVFFAVMAMTWDVYLLIPLIVIPYFIFGIILIASESSKETFDKNEVIHFAAKVLLSMLVMTIFFYLPISSYFIRSSTFWLENIAGVIGGSIGLSTTIVLIGIIIGVLAGIGIAYFISQSNKSTKKTIETIALVLLFLSVIAMIGYFFIEPDFFYKNGGRLTVGSLVGEESVGNQFFGTKYNALIIFPWAAIILLPFGLYFFRKEDSHTQLIFFFWTIVTLFMAWYKLKFTFIFGLGVVTGVAITIYLIIEMLKKFDLLKALEGKFTIIALGFLLLLGVGATAIFVPDYAPFPNQDPSQIQLFNWINENTAKDAKFFNWWNDGHVLAYETERKFSSDNRNLSNFANASYAEFMITTDTNKAYDIVKNQIGADYIIMGSDVLNSLPTFEYYASNSVDQRLLQKYSKGSFFSLSCVDYNTTVSCGGNQLNKADYLKISTTWKSTPDAFPDGTNPVYYYRTTSNELFVVNDVVNKTNFIKVLFNSPETSGKYTLVYDNGSEKIIKVN